MVHAEGIPPGSKASRSTVPGLVENFSGECCADTDFDGLRSSDLSRVTFDDSDGSSEGNGVRELKCDISDLSYMTTWISIEMGRSKMKKSPPNTYHIPVISSERNPSRSLHHKSRKSLGRRFLASPLSLYNQTMIVNLVVCKGATPWTI